MRRTCGAIRLAAGIGQRLEALAGGADLDGGAGGSDAGGFGFAVGALDVQLGEARLFGEGGVLGLESGGFDEGGVLGELRVGANLRSDDHPTVIAGLLEGGAGGMLG